ncbi:hypothetical protein GCM10023149_14330 [Mucilaginibacter gynuensis]|uniref:Uncharacterized protein n=1 Tax=Mucilaginibacter gynuensis TaxID=1302236 RepID=A0ABP8G474_9SPHI
MADLKSRTSLTDEYIVNGGNGEVIIDLIIGAMGQSGISIIKLDSVVLADEIIGSLVGFVIGTNKEVENKFLTVTTIITDVSKDSDVTSLDFAIKGGNQPFKAKMERAVQGEGDSVAYDIDIFFHQQLL